LRVTKKNAFTDHALGIIGILFLHQNRSRKNTLRINDMVDLGTVARKIHLVGVQSIRKLRAVRRRL